MKQKEVFKKIGGIIKELSEQYDYLQSVTEDLNDLELELFVSNAHFLTDHIEILRKLNLQNNRLTKPSEEKKEAVAEEIIESVSVEKKELARDEKKDAIREEKYFEPMVQQMKPSTVNKTFKPSFEQAEEETTPALTQTEDQAVPHIDLSTVREDSYSFVRQDEPETIRHELILDESQNWDDEDEFFPTENEGGEHIYLPEEGVTIELEKPATITERETIVPETESRKVKTEPVIIEDKALTVNQKMSVKLGDKTFSKSDQQIIKPISDIKLAITLNDKLLYIKDLFNGYNLAYSEAIEILNRFNTFEEASRFLNTNYVVKNNWEGKPATTEKFYALLRRRYA